MRNSGGEDHADNQRRDNTRQVAAHVEHPAGNSQHFLRRGVAQHAPAEVTETFSKEGQAHGGDRHHFRGGVVGDDNHAGEQHAADHRQLAGGRQAVAAFEQPV